MAEQAVQQSATMMRRPDRAAAAKTYTENHIGQLAEWTVGDVLEALRAHEMGMFMRSALLVDAMGRDDRIESALDTIIRGILRLPFAVDAGDGEQAEEVRLAFARFFASAFPESEAYDFVRWFLMLGFGLAELKWDTSDPTRWKIEGIKVWHPQYIYYRQDTRRLVLLTQEGPVDIEPGNGKWVLLSMGERGWMLGAVRSLAKSFLLREFVFRDWARNSEVHGQGILKIQVPSDADAADKQRFFLAVQNIGTDSAIECPVNKDGQNFDVGLLESMQDHGEGFEKLLLRTEANINVRILGQAGTVEAGGVYVAKGVFSKVTLDRIDGTVGPLETALYEQMAKPWAEFNYGDAALAPKPNWDSEPPEDKQKRADTIKGLAAAVKDLDSALAPSGKRTNALAMAEQFGVPTLELPKTTDQAPSIQLAPTDLAKIVKVNEGRASAGLGPLLLASGERDPDGDLTIEEFATKKAAVPVAPTDSSEAA